MNGSRLPQVLLGCLVWLDLDVLLSQVGVSLVHIDHNSAERFGVKLCRIERSVLKFIKRQQRGLPPVPPHNDARRNRSRQDLAKPSTIAQIIVRGERGESSY